MLQVTVHRRGYLLVLLAYITPIVVGGLIVISMLKPLLARPARDKEGYLLKPDKDPILFEFISRVCEAVGAPQPSVIEFTMDVNAAAAPRKGLFSLVRRDLRLVIGVPLIAGITVEQLGGILAHEFGHFSQSTGLILSSLIIRMNYWFTRMVFQRDQFDYWLEAAAHGLDFRIGWVLHLGRLGIWLSRTILYGLMILGWAVSGRFSQQMEFDADRYQVRLAGSHTVENTLPYLALLDAGHQLAISTLIESLSRREVVDDYPRLILEKSKQLPPEIAKKIKKAMRTQQTRWFDTHPSLRDRIENARRENAPGILHSEYPASVLFRDFDRFCQKYTRYYFKQEIGMNLKGFSISAAEEILDSEQKWDA